MAVTLSEALLARYPRFSLYNSPYTAHDRGRAIDLYPAEGAPSPVSGEVLDTRTVRAPPKPYAPEHDHLLVIDCGDRIARILHVDPAVEAGDHVEVGDPLGSTLRAGFFAPWVDDHLHVGFRAPDANPYRASGSLPIEIDARVEPVVWDGTGRVNAVGETFVVLDAPAHPAPGQHFAGIADDSGETAIDGGLPHYAGAGALAGASGPLSLLGERIGTATGRDLAWDPIEVRANGNPITGLSLFAGRETLGAKLVCPGHDFAVGERIEVSIRPGR
ncbi:hypothetical protein [Halalkalicoccus jeotgali]|uniref:Uncharacterized protein n=1 Tax=Halalkalicoccus jeotgali (strain DSM 18796 / CECT 7217 / JCM 14584 / KCTC 4019 / B3) TaxID=795797 RepID=D8J981_HALJB|nr:hypothetical protein [Halalkalicoccus jeotgali]ADJ16350.1 hypothetical protein HacjB3_14855 [Halalkalicoccus jeotgali B3]ELY37084.1 hypothetical protein C497_10083 [Halalkalicoccus jeotgali B3]